MIRSGRIRAGFAALLLPLTFALAGCFGGGPPGAAPVRPGYGPGTYVVGSQIAPGTYRTRAATPGCYWERLSGFGGSFSEIIAYEFTNDTTIVTISPTDVGFRTSGCDGFVGDLSPITSSPFGLFGDGHYIVGTDVAPGTWASVGGGSCYWERQRGFSGSFADIIDNHFGAGNAVVTIGPGDIGFKTDGCGVWSKIA